MGIDRGDVHGQVPAIAVQLLPQHGPGLAHLLVLVDVLNRLLQADGDNQPDDDCRDVDEKVCPAMNGFVRRLNVDHAGSGEKWMEVRYFGC
jgi:hypothetical protein